ncbi:MAG: hydrogenase nickel incorporation protein HypA [Acidilobaceae archaeon]
MHELALASAIVSAIREAVEKEGSKVKLVRIYLGELQSLDASVLEEYIRMSLKDYDLSVSYEILEEEAVFKCRRCGLEWRLRDESISEEVREYIHFLPEAIHAFIKCPFCASSDFDVVSGRGVRLSIVLSEGG